MNNLVLENEIPVSLWQLLCNTDGSCRQCGHRVQTIILYPCDIMVRHTDSLHFCQFQYENPDFGNLTRKEVTEP